MTRHLFHSGHHRLSNPHDPEESRGGPADSRCGYFDAEAGDELVYTLAESTCPDCRQAELGSRALVADHARAIDRKLKRRGFSRPFRGRK